MGHINFFDLNSLIKIYKAEVFIETGTYIGDSLAHAALYPFKKLYSIEIDPDLVQRAREKFKNDPRIEIVQGSSSEVLEGILNNNQENTIVWLDAHFPTTPADRHNYGIEKEKDIRVPLEKEISVLQKRIGKFNDVILVDDLRCYEDNIPGVVSFNDHMKSLGQSHITREDLVGVDSKFIYDAFSDTHDIVRHSFHEGYLSVTPKQKILDKFDKVVFFNHGNLGDTLIAKIFIKEIIKQLPDKQTAVSNKFNYDYVKDVVDEHIHVDYIPIDKNNISDRSREFLLKDRVLYINSWFAPPCVQPENQEKYLEFRNDIRSKSNVVHGYDLHLKCFQQVFTNLKNTLGLSISLDHMWHNKSDFILDLYDEHIDLENIPFFNDLSKKKILIYNQPATSGQSDNVDFTPYILDLINREDVVVYTSRPTNIDNPRVVCLQQWCMSPDLFKIAKLSVFCDIICGPSNATVISSWVKSNINRSNLTYIIINRNDVGEATLFENMTCTVDVVISTQQLFEKVKGKL